MSTHSKFLVHWTGGGKDDIESNPEGLRPRLYFERLLDDYQNGLFARRTSEDVIRGWKINDLIRLCFTEIRLSSSKEHADRYGKLGIGFTRDFIMDRGGRPVIYIPFEAKSDGRLLEASIKNVFERSDTFSDKKESFRGLSDEALDNIQEIHRSSKWIVAHVKRMSKGKEIKIGEDYYEEMEWRLVHDETPDNKHFTRDKGEGIHRIKFKASDVKVIIFPDEDTKQISLRDEEMRKYFAEHTPLIATLEDC